MSATITLEEALELATPAPYEIVGKNLCTVADDRNRKTIATFQGGTFNVSTEDFVTRALLAHCRNVLPEVVAALKWTHDAVLTMQGNNGIPRHAAKSISDHIAPILAKATTVTLP